MTIVLLSTQPHSSAPWKDGGGDGHMQGRGGCDHDDMVCASSSDVKATSRAPCLPPGAART